MPLLTTYSLQTSATCAALGDWCPANANANFPNTITVSGTMDASLAPPCGSGAKVVAKATIAATARTLWPRAAAPQTAIRASGPPPSGAVRSAS